MATRSEYKEKMRRARVENGFMFEPFYQTMTAKEIAKKFGVGKNYVFKCLRDANIKTRSSADCGAMGKKTQVDFNLADELLSNGTKIGEVCDILNVSRKVFNLRAKENGFDARKIRKRFLQNQKEKIKAEKAKPKPKVTFNLKAAQDLLNKGHSKESVARKVGISATAIRNAVNRGYLHMKVNASKISHKRLSKIAKVKIPSAANVVEEKKPVEESPLIKHMIDKIGGHEKALSLICETRGKNALSYSSLRKWADDNGSSLPISYLKTAAIKLQQDMQMGINQ